MCCRQARPGSREVAQTHPRRGGDRKHHGGRHGPVLGRADRRTPPRLALMALPPGEERPPADPGRRLAHRACAGRLRTRGTGTGPLRGPGAGAGPGRDERLPGMVQQTAGDRRRPTETDGVIRAATAQLWFSAMHPFEDGNGQIARAITDIARARSQSSPMRLYSVSHRILRRGTRTTTHWRTPPWRPRGPATSPPGSAGSPGASAGPWTTPWRRCLWRSRTPS